MPDVFISYSRKDRAFVQQLHAALIDRGRDSWVDWEDIPLSADWLAEIYNGIEAADAFVFVISPDSVISEICGLEVAHAVEHHKRLIPVLRREVDTKLVPQPVGAHNWIYFRESDAFGEAFDRLLSALDTDLEWVHAHTRLLTRALEWQRRDADASLLLRGNDLQAAEGWMVRAARELAPSPTSLQRQFVLASRRAATRRQRSLLGAVSTTLVVTLLLALLAVFQWRSAVTARGVAEDARATAETQRTVAEEQARRALSRQLAAQALNRASSSLDLALLLGVWATRTEPTIEALSSLLTTLQASPHLRTSLRSHTAPVEDVAWSPDGTLVASTDISGTVRLWDPRTLRQVGTPFTTAGGELHRLSWSPDGRTLAGAGCAQVDATRLCSSGGIWLWDATSRALRGHLTGHPTEIWDLAWSPDSTRLVSVGGIYENAGLIIWDVDAQQPLGEALNGDPNGMSSVAWSPDGTLIAAGGDASCEACPDDTIFFVDAATGEQVGPNLDGQGYGVSSLAWSPDGKGLAAGHHDGSIVLWARATWTPRLPPLTGHAGNVSTIAWRHDGAMIASAGYDGTVMLWDSESGQRVDTPLRGHRDAVMGLDWSPDGSGLVSGSIDKKVVLWDVATAQPLARAIDHHTANLEGIAFAQDGKRVISASRAITITVSSEFDVHATSLETGSPEEPRIQGQAASLALRGDGAMLAVGAEDGTITLWSIETGQQVGAPILAHRYPVTALAWSKDGQHLASAGCEERQTGTVVCEAPDIRLWDVTTRAAVGQPLLGHRNDIVDLRFSPDGRTLASSNTFEVILWNVARGEMLGQPPTLQTDMITNIAWSPDGQRLAVTGTSTSRLVTAASRAFNMIMLLDATTGQPDGEPFGSFEEGVQSVAWRPDGTLLAAGDAAGHIQLWDVATRQAIGGPLLYSASSIEALEFTPDGKTLVSGDADGEVVAWIAGLDAWQIRACRMVGRDVTPAEWTLFGPNNTAPQAVCGDGGL